MFIRTIKNILRPGYRLFKATVHAVRIWWDTRRLLTAKRIPSSKVFYFGITEHSNLGDMAQCYCIRQWIAENYPEHSVYEFTATTVVDERFGFLKKLQSCLSKQDMIIFQSGYTTQDLRGIHERMHRIVMEAVPWANIIMMPQTIYFRSPERKALTAKIYNTASNMLFLARDRVSYAMACEMFPDIAVRQFPDIVTSLIGTYSSDSERSGVLLCCRSDDEKLYSDAELQVLQQKLSAAVPVDRIDTRIDVDFREIHRNAKYFIDQEIAKYAKHKLVITDRYHGTIFSLAANTPVIVLKTNDHKVSTGVEWFFGIYDEYVCLAEDLSDAYDKAMAVLSREYAYKLQPYFKEEYYNKLLALWECAIERRDYR